MTSACELLFAALHFAADKHRDQRRKDIGASPYINHPIEVADLLARVGRVDDAVTLMAAVLHDTVEDTQTTPEELQAHFGSEVSAVVMEVTDDKSLPKMVRKQLQIDHAPHLTLRARQVKLADKIANVRSIIDNPPANWPLEQKLDYFDWTEKVVAGLRGCNSDLEAYYDRMLARGRETLSPVS